jgi:hypothetical protein
MRQSFFIIIDRRVHAPQKKQGGRELLERLSGHARRRASKKNLKEWDKKKNGTGGRELLADT